MDSRAGDSSKPVSTRTRVQRVFEAARIGDVDTVRRALDDGVQPGTLLEAGADPGIRDDTYNATPRDWAEYCGQPRIAELLRARGVSGPRSMAPSA